MLQRLIKRLFGWESVPYAVYYFFYAFFITLWKDWVTPPYKLDVIIAYRMGLVCYVACRQGKRDMFWACYWFR